MKNKLLLPNKFKKVGWYILLPAIAISIILGLPFTKDFELQANVLAILGGSHPFDIIHTDIIATILGVLLIVGGLLVVFSKEKNEDEYIAHLRLTSLMWATLVNYLLLLFAFVFFYSFSFLTVMIYNLFTVLIIFIIRFHYILRRNFKSNQNEE